MPNWYYTDTTGQKRGLINNDQLKALVVRGIITPDTLLETDTGKKGKAGQIKGLFPAVSPPVTQAAAPKTLIPVTTKSKRLPLIIGITAALVIGVIALLAFSPTKQVANDNPFLAGQMVNADNPFEDPAVEDTLAIFPTDAVCLDNTAQFDPATAVPKPFLPKLKYPTADLFVATLNIMDFKGADNTGQTDMASLIQTLLRRLEGSTAKEGGVGNGGVLFLPEGKYLLNSNITIPKGVTIRGEWQRPIRGKPITGTIIVSDFGRGEETPRKSLFILEPLAAVKDLAFWYPKQNPENIVPYPPTIGYGAPEYWGNDYCVTQNVTFVNAYSGCILIGGGGAPNMFGLYGTPLKRGIEIDDIAEVGRVENVDFSPEYWIGSGLPGSPSPRSAAAAFKNWLRNNGTAVVMRRNDWSFVSNLTADGYWIGFHLAPSKVGGIPNGQNYLLRFTNCQTALCAEAMAPVGVMFHDVHVERCDYGVLVPSNAFGTVQLTNWHIEAAKYAVGIDRSASAHILIGQSRIVSGSIETFGGTLAFLDCDIDTQGQPFKVGSESRVLMAGNRLRNVSIDNQSMFETHISNEPINDFKKIPEFPYKDIHLFRQRPDRAALYVATDAPFNVKANDNTVDNTQPLQTALNHAASHGGGIVYLPPGKYRMLGHITIPEGVELKGAVDVGSQPMGPGSVLEAYEGKGNANAPPFITMQRRSGLRGVVINYPEQRFNEILKGTGDRAILDPHVYPYAVRIAGEDVYLVNVGFRAIYSGVDMFTHRADNVYIEYPSGHFFTNGFRIGGGTENAHIRNVQFNTIGYACGAESKFGLWANSPIPQGDIPQPANRQNWRDLRFFILDDCRNLLLFNNFHFGSQIGTVFGSEQTAPSGLALGHAIDAAVIALQFNKIGSEGFNLIGSQIVSLRQGNVERSDREARYIQTAPGFDGRATLFSADFWGNPYYGVELGGGHVHLQLARFNNAGSERLLEANPRDGGRLHISGSSVDAPSDRTPVNGNGTKQLEAEFSLIGTGNRLRAGDFGRFYGNLSYNPKVNASDRRTWRATASVGSGANNMFDGNTGTRWSTDRPMQRGDWIVLDMGTPQTFNTIILHSGNSINDFPGRYEAFVSDDGRRWGDAVVTGAGSQNRTVIRFPTEQRRRYVRIVLTVPNPEAPFHWSVAEAYIARTSNESIVPPQQQTAERKTDNPFAD